MPKKQDPVVGVLRYFRDAELALAQQALTLAKETVKAREPQPVAKPKKPRTRKPTPAPDTHVARQTQPDLPAPVPPAAPSRRRIKPPTPPAPAAATPRKEEDVPLPGIVSEVGGQ